jgi:tRNA(Ile)-lysidine synthase TilS/MesJ
LKKRILRKIRNANHKYNLIESGDRVAVGMSGGKDSMVLLHFLGLLQKYTPLDFSIVPIYLDLGWNNDITSLYNACHQANLELICETTNIGYVVFEARQEKNPCSLCSNLRRGALHRCAKAQGCNKVALGHHLDDAVQTLLMSILFESRYHLFKPRTYLDRIDITLIRPLIYVEETEIRAMLAYLGFDPVKNLCPADGFTKREDIKDLLNEIQGRFPGAKRNFLASIENVDQNSFWSSEK